MAKIERGMEKANECPSQASEASLCLTSDVRLSINRPISQCIMVDSSAFTLPDGLVMILTGEEKANREEHIYGLVAGLVPAIGKLDAGY